MFMCVLQCCADFTVLVPNLSANFTGVADSVKLKGSLGRQMQCVKELSC